MISLANSRVLITGANGFIGRYLTTALAKQGAVISILTRKPTHLPFTHEEYIGDLRDAEFVDACIEQSNPKVIFHLAAFKERSSDLSVFSAAIQNNLIGSLHLFAATMKLQEAPLIVIMGTAEEYGQNICPFVEGMRESPVSAYSFSKLCVKHLCEVLNNQYKMPFVIVRPTLAYGPGQNTDMFLPALIKALITNSPFSMTWGKQTRDFIYITDLVDALIRAAIYPNINGQIINIGSGLPISLADTALMVQKLLKKTGLLQIGKIDYRPGEVMEYYVDITRAQQLLEWKPKVKLEQGLINTINFYCEEFKY